MVRGFGYTSGEYFVVFEDQELLSFVYFFLVDFHFFFFERRMNNF